MNETYDDHSAGPVPDAYRVGYLIAGFIQDTLTDAEQEELDDWVTASDANMRLFAELTDEKNIEKGLRERGLYDADKAVALLNERRTRPAAKSRGRRVRLYGWVAAACVVVLAGVFFLLPRLNETVSTPAVAATRDLPPGGEKAVLQLPDGRVVILDQQQGEVLTQEGLQVRNAQHTLRYEGEGGAVAYHTLRTPRGGQYQVVLADGTKVWLNAASSIRYPTAFAGPERRVEVSGEAYFEVAHDAARPFRVQAGETEVTVVGTHFNVRAYADEGGTRTTLLEGSVAVSAGKERVIIKPGQQAVVPVGGKLKVVADADLEEVMGWKNGVFEFNDEPIEAIMKEVGRWYDAEVRYEGTINYHFNASIGRDVPVSKLLHFLELTNRVHFTIRDQTIIVQP